MAYFFKALSKKTLPTASLKSDPLFDASLRSARLMDRQLRLRVSQVRWFRLRNIWNNTLVLIKPKTWFKLSVLLLLSGVAAGYGVPLLIDLFAQSKPIPQSSKAPVAEPAGVFMPAHQNASGNTFESSPLEPQLKLSFSLSKPTN